MKRWTFVVIALALLVGCDATPPQGYFPLTGGLQWHYRVSRSDALGNHQTGERVLTNLGPATFDNEQVFERRNSFGT
ncbi:MAG: hypothetical protein L0H19_04515, partial [Salinisphaera sp.]|nr:hypothetical protein [Salinisphaera sp.]